MTPKRWLIVAVWIIIMGAFVTKFFSQDKRLGRSDDLSAVPSPTPQHFFALHGKGPGDEKPSLLKPGVADVRQVAFSYTLRTPEAHYFTCHVTLMNGGALKATHVQVQVRPFRGIPMGNPDGGRFMGSDPNRAISDDNPVAQYNAWVSFPDIEPGQTVSRDAVFFNRPGYTPGDNPNPQIIFETDKPKPAASSGPQFPPNL